MPAPAGRRRARRSGPLGIDLVRLVDLVQEDDVDRLVLLTVLLLVFVLLVLVVFVVEGLLEGLDLALGGLADVERRRAVPERAPFRREGFQIGFEVFAFE